MLPPMLGSALALVVTSPQPSNPPQTFILQLPSDHWGRAIQIAQAVLLLAQTALLAVIAVWTSRTGSQQKIRERRAGWYHKVVVDRGLPSISSFYQSETDELQRRAVECLALRNAGQAAQLDALVKNAIAAFKAELYRLQNDLADRAAVFDLKFKESVSETLDELEEIVTDWFDVHAFSRTRTNEKELPRLLAESQTELLKILYDFEFTHFG